MAAQQRSPSEDDSHTIIARAREASTGKAPYPYNCLPPTLRHPFKVEEPREQSPDQTADKGDERNRESTGQGSTSGDSWNNWSKKSPSQHIMGDRPAHLARIKGDLVVTKLKSEQRAIERSRGSRKIGHECPEVVIDNIVEHEKMSQLKHLKDDIEESFDNDVEDKHVFFV
ncbi:hypothetical protein VNO80_10507 [Phaseolus coccineus]|uniref:Uncharacterized protein n=1 Tax=Phaseolus coccineus TaxID=3886 RepID=A0AAN9RDH2_PHACN